MAVNAKSGFKATIDRPKLERSLKSYAKQFGDTSAQAVIRWSVQACRELAFETQAWGRNSKKIQQQAILSDGWNVCLVVKKLTRKGKSYKAEGINGDYYVSVDRVLKSAEEVNNWIEVNRTRRRGRTARLSNNDKMVCDEQTFKAGMKARLAKAGMAKGAWLGAGMDIARSQTGQAKISIGKNYMSYAQKHSHFGSAKKPQSGWKPVAGITNSTRHVSSKDVLAPNAAKKAIEWGLKKSVTWYRSAIRNQNKKKP